MKKSIGITAAIVFCSFTLAACGSDSDGGDGYQSEPAETGSTSDAAVNTPAGNESGAGGKTLTIMADPSGALAFTKSELTAKAGSGTLEFENASSTGHNVEIEDASGEEVAETDTITADTTTAPVDLKPGTYTFYCNIPGHKEAGMEGTLTVK